MCVAVGTPTIIEVGNLLFGGAHSWAGEAKAVGLMVTVCDGSEEGENVLLKLRRQKFILVVRFWRPLSAAK